MILLWLHTHRSTERDMSDLVGQPSVERHSDIHSNSAHEFRGLQGLGLLSEHAPPVFNLACQHPMAIRFALLCASQRLLPIIIIL